MTAAVTDDRPAAEPVLRVIRGDATPEEVAALVAVLMSRAAAAASAQQAPSQARSAWSDRSRLVRGPLSPGPGAWRRSVLPG